MWWWWWVGGRRGGRGRRAGVFCVPSTGAWVCQGGEAVAVGCGSFWRQRRCLTVAERVRVMLADRLARNQCFWSGRAGGEKIVKKFVLGSLTKSK